MKLHLPTRLRSALLACCSVACTISPFFFSAAPAYALTVETIDAVTTYSSGGKSVSFAEGGHINMTDA
ncbi:MAG: hypothetical protein IJB00_01260 [Akkermansia sp.]|nr:hypothetical protein [Akkermansia sp.]